MEIFGGFMVMLSIIGFFLTVLWFILPFVIFGIKGKVDRSVQLLEQLESRLASLEARLVASAPQAAASGAETPPGIPPSAAPAPSSGDQPAGDCSGE